MNKTSFRITNATQVLEKILVLKMDVPRNTFHRRAIDYFIESGERVHPHLLIKTRNDPNYVKKDKMEQIYLDDDRKAALERIAEKNGCGITIVLFQALMSYCNVMAPIVLGEETIKKLFGQDSYKD